MEVEHMETVELREKFHNLIDHIDDVEVLEGFYIALDHYHNKNGNKDIVDHLTEEQKVRLHQSIRQSETGNTIPHETVRAQIKEWITK
jgi:hypothetical protein